MKRKMIAMLVVLLVFAMISPALAKSNTMTSTTKQNFFLALGYWDEYGCDDEYCWGSYKEVYVRDENAKADYVTLEIYMYEYREPIWDGEEPKPEGNGDDYYWEEYWNSFQIPRSDFVVAKNLTGGAVLDTMTADGPVHLVWDIQETNYERSRNTYATEGVKYSFRAKSTYGTGTVSGHIFGEEMGESNYGAMGYVSLFERIRQTY